MGGKHEAHVDIILRIIGEKPCTQYEIQQVMKIRMTTIRGRLSQMNGRRQIYKDSFSRWHVA